MNCSLKTHLEHLPGKEPVLCRKTTQKSNKIDFNTNFLLPFAAMNEHIFYSFFLVFGKIRVVRDCGYLRTADDDMGCVKRSGTFEVQSFFCSCTNDLCNAASITHHSLTYVIGALFVVSIMSILN